ncbi:MAG: hypothetical protein IJH07_01820 [Ruminococcus sp.]|nr:hypothetical protein [Ruminococcus sp.]
MTEKKMDELMKAYCDPDTEPFVYQEKKHSGLKAASVIAAALVLVVLGTLIIPSLMKTKHSFVLTVNAAGREVSDEQVGTAYTKVTVYDKDHAYIGEYYKMDTQILMDGEDIDAISFRSLNGFGKFILWYNPVKGDWREDSGMWYDADGNEDSSFNGALYRIEGDHYEKADAIYTSNWSTEYRYNLYYVALNDEGTFLQPDEATEDRNDTIEITVTFTDGETQTRRLSVTYPDGVMTVEEIT